MSFAIIRNTKYKRENLKGIYRHNKRRNKNYSNDNIDKEKSFLNYSLKSPKYRYDKEFDMMKEKYNLKGQIKTVSNIACEYIITSDKQFFEEIGEEETKRYFETSHNFEPERGVPKEETGREHIDIKEYKEITNFDKTKEKLQNMKLELPDVPEIDDIKMVRRSKKRDEKILEDIIKPKDDLINELYQNNLLMNQQFIHWICKKFDMGAEDNLIRDFQKETNTFLDAKNQLKHEEREKEWDLER